MPAFMALCTKEAGKTLPDGIAEVREAVDFLRYYAAQAREQFGAPSALPGPTGESNQLQLAGPRRVRLHQPVELPAGDLPRPDRRRAGRRQQRDRQAGRADQPDRLSPRSSCCTKPACPQDVLQFLPGDGATVGAALTRDPRVAGVCLHRLDRNRAR